MILRYFYIQRYGEIVKNLNINLGGKYRFNYDEEKQKFEINEENYVEKLYSQYDVISDISAILGKNGAGKTTVLRIINWIFNNFYGESSIKYIVVLEDENNKYFIHTNIKMTITK